MKLYMVKRGGSYLNIPYGRRKDNAWVSGQRRATKWGIEGALRYARAFNVFHPFEARVVALRLSPQEGGK